MIRDWVGSRGRWHIASGLVRSFAEEELLHLPRQVLARPRIGQVQAVLIDQHRLVLLPQLECFLADVVVDPLPELARVWRIDQPFGFLLKVNALHGAAHLETPACDLKCLTSTCERRSQLYLRLRASGSQSASAGWKPRLMNQCIVR